jgi:pyruvate-formate lyase-activating enzyme
MSGNVSVVPCSVCENSCLISEGESGICGRYINQGGVISERYPNRYLLACPIRIETMPMLHFHPGARFLQVSTVGCNFNCPGCISAVIVREMNPQSRAIHEFSPDEIIEKARQNGCRGITFVMNDPLAAFDTFMAVAHAAKEAGLYVGCSSNGYFSLQSLQRILPVLDFINLGIKGLSDESYHACGGYKGAAPVLRNIRMLHKGGVHIEIACIHTTKNAEELLELCRTIKDISTDIPVQIMRFIPLEGADPRLEPLIRETESLCGKMRKMLDYVYVFNSPGTHYLNTLCPDCGKIVLHRDFYGPMGARLKKASLAQVEPLSCPNCHSPIGICGMGHVSDFREKDFQGGYPFTRALEIVESVLIAIGVESKAEVVRVWEDLLCNNRLHDLHHNIQRVDKYLEMIKSFGDLIGRREKADQLAGYLESKAEEIKSACIKFHGSPRVYYAMGKPAFCIKGERFENHLVELCGGTSVNKEIEVRGRPGMSIELDVLEKLNPEIIFISSFISNSPEDFYHECVEKGLKVDAVKNSRIYTSPVPSSDFGSPKWILGMMNIANEMYKGEIYFNINEEAQEFYKLFYGASFDMKDVNRSFGKPNMSWKWSPKPGKITTAPI